MPEQVKKTPCCTALFAHVDAGKTTLSEAVLYLTGAKRTLGRVDHQNTFLDTHALERMRGITIFAKPALFSTENLEITLVDTPGHADFGAEAERVMPILDCAVLVISATDGIQAHTLTLWHLLEAHHIPVFLFFNKTDLPGLSKEALLSQVNRQLGAGFVDFQAPGLAENVALCDEALLDTYLATGKVTDANIQELIRNRRLFPCCFGAALKLTGVEEFLGILDRYAPRPEYTDVFSARVYKISRDESGTRLTWLKITGGTLRVRASLSYAPLNGQPCEEKVVQLRRYSGEKFTVLEEACAGTVCAVTGLSATYAGLCLGTPVHEAPPMLEPVMTCRMVLPPSCDPMTALPKLRQLEEEDPQLHLLWQDGQLHVQIMGKVQQEILKSLVCQRFGLEITFSDQRIFYQETITDTVEGVGHFEPLRHYAEVHLLLEPLPRGSGLVFESQCPADVLEPCYQSLVITHLAEKLHKGVLLGAPITDMKLTLLVGKAHQKHTQGGDFRQATYRAVRQGLMRANSVILEPWYRFQLVVPREQIGRAITDMRAMSGAFDPPEDAGAFSILRGKVPAAELKDYADTVAAYTQGRGQLQTAFCGYDLCHNSEQILAQTQYDPEADLENTPDSVFCAHGAGFCVKWDQVEQCMHLESGLKTAAAPVLLPRNLRIDDKELEAILEREFGSGRVSPKPQAIPASEKLVIRPPRPQSLIVDGYNIIFAWEDLAQTAKSDLDAARRELLDCLSSFAGYRKWRTIVVFDGYRVRGNLGEKERYHNIQVVYTKENETADQYIEALTAKIGANDAVRVATSDALIQLSSLRAGVLRMSARELYEQVETARQEMRKHFGNPQK